MKPGAVQSVLLAGHGLVDGWADQGHAPTVRNGRRAAIRVAVAKGEQGE
jgi:hypothetical protein